MKLHCNKQFFNSFDFKFKTNLKLFVILIFTLFVALGFFPTSWSELRHHGPARWKRPKTKNERYAHCLNHIYMCIILISYLVSADKYIWFLQGMSTTMPRFTSSSRQAPNPIVISHDANDDWLNTDDVFRGNASDDEQVNQKKSFSSD